MKPIIFADDNVLSRRAFEQHASSHYTTRIDVVKNGLELVDKVRENDYSIIVTDNQMPKLSGIEAIKIIREFRPDVPILMLSGSRSEQLALESGASAYLEKPIIRDNVYNAIDKLVGRY